MAQRRYVCAKGPGFGGCGKTYINAEPVERFVVEAVLHRLDSPELAAGYRAASADDAGGAALVAGEIEAAQAQLDELADAYGQPRDPMARVARGARSRSSSG